MTSPFETRRSFAVIIALGLFAMAVRNVSDPDVWWHLRTGQLILQNRAVFRADPYSFTKFGAPWVNHEWLLDVFIFVLHRTVGWVGPIAIFAAITAAAFLLLLLRCQGRPVVAAVFTVWGAIASAPSFGARPQAISLFLASLLLVLLDRSEVRSNLLWWILPLVLTWVNLHAGFALGIGLVFLFLLGEMLDAAFGFRESDAAWSRVGKLALVLTACVAIVPMNVYGARMYWYPLQTVHSRTMQMYISEWGSPNFHSQMYLPVLLLLLATFVAVSVSPLRLRPRDLLLLSVTAWAALHSARHVPLYALVAVPILSGLANAWFDENWPRFGANVQQVPRTSASQALNAIMLAMILMLAAFRVCHVVQSQSRRERQVFPATAVSFLQENKLPGPLFNSYNWGGYLIWRLYPEYLVFIDGRADLYGDSFMDQFAATYQLADSSWRSNLDQWRIQSVILPPDAPLVAALRLIPAWKQVYGDSQAVILEATPPAITPSTIVPPATNMNVPSRPK